MPFSFRIRYRRTYRSNGRYRRSKRSFSKYNTYRNRSATAQANQIYRLNKRLNKIESNTKPEYLEYGPTTVGNLIATIPSVNTWNDLTPLHITDLANASSFGEKMKGTSARVFKIIVWGALERNPAVLPENVDSHDSSMTCGYVRMAVIQYQAEKYADVSVYNVFNTDSGPAGYYHPLVRGCGSHARILKVFNIKISSQDPVTKNFKFVIKPKNKVVTKTLDESGSPLSNQRMKNGIAIIAIGHIENNNITHPDTYHLSMSAKAIYTDA